MLFFEKQSMTVSVRMIVQQFYFNNEYNRLNHLYADSIKTPKFQMSYCSNIRKKSKALIYLIPWNDCADLFLFSPKN